MVDRDRRRNGTAQSDAVSSRAGFSARRRSSRRKRRDARRPDVRLARSMAGTGTRPRDEATLDDGLLVGQVHRA